MTIKDWLMRNCRFAQQQYLDFYDPAEYRPAKPVYEQQDQQFWNWIRAENNPTKINSVEALQNVMMDYPSYTQTFLRTYDSVYNHNVVQFPTGKTVETLKIGRTIFVMDRQSASVENASDFLHGLDEWNLDEYYPEKDFNKEFWEGVGGGFVLYHATPPENVPAILKRGLKASDQTRGISNRGMGNAVFTSPEPSSIASYGEAIFAINVSAMKAAGYMPSVSQEEPFAAEGIKSAIAHRLGIEEWVGGEYDSEGLTEDTIAFFGDIPPKFLSLYQ